MIFLAANNEHREAPQVWSESEMQTKAAKSTAAKNEPYGLHQGLWRVVIESLLTYEKSFTFQRVSMQ